MAYTPYYNDGWQSGEEGGTPITPDALNHMEAGIEGANNNMVPVTRGGTGATNAASARANLEITPANIGAYGAGSVGTITDANDTSLYGSRMFQANACANLPTNESGVFYQVEFFGGCQMAFRFSSTGITETWGRYYTNSRWYPWVRIDKVTGIKGDAESTYRTGDVNLTPANIGAHPAQTSLVVTNDTDYSGDTTTSKPVALIVDTSNFIRHQLYGVYNSSGAFYTCLSARRPNGSSAISNLMLVGFDADGNGSYFISYPEAFRNAIGATNTRVKGAAESSYRTGDVNLTAADLGLGNVNNSLVLTAATGTDLYEQLNALPVSPTNGAGVTCYINNPALQLLTGKTNISGTLQGAITRISSTRFRVFGLYGENNYIMYWTFDITSAGAITPMTVYKLQGTAM